MKYLKRGEMSSKTAKYLNSIDKGDVKWELNNKDNLYHPVVETYGGIDFLRQLVNDIYGKGGLLEFDGFSPTSVFLKILTTIDDYTGQISNERAIFIFETMLKIAKNPKSDEAHPLRVLGIKVPLPHNIEHLLTESEIERSLEIGIGILKMWNENEKILAAHELENKGIIPMTKENYEVFREEVTDVLLGDWL